MSGALLYLGVLMVTFLLGIPVALGLGGTSIILTLLERGVEGFSATFLAQRATYGLNNFLLAGCRSSLPLLRQGHEHRYHYGENFHLCRISCGLDQGWSWPCQRCCQRHFRRYDRNCHFGCCRTWRSGVGRNER